MKIDAKEAVAVKSEQRDIVLSLESVHAGYGKKEILRGLSLTIRHGDFIAFIGVNGAGKSTALKTIAGLIRPTQGRILFNGVDIARFSVTERVRLGIAYLMQGGIVFPSLTVRENLEVGAYILPAGERAASTEAVFDMFPVLRDNLNRRAGLLSGGQRQSLALGMVLVQRPRLLLLDEPSAGLAPNVAREVLSRIRRFSQVTDVAILLVEQKLREALEIADSAFVLGRGIIWRKPEGTCGSSFDPALEEILFGATAGLSGNVITR